MSKNTNILSEVFKYITEREESLFTEDLTKNHEQLLNNIKGKSALVIGGAGTIGSNFIKELLKYEPGKLFVIDTNENGLTELSRDLRSTEGLSVPDDYKTYSLDFDDPIFKRIFSDNGPFHIVANFAAHKHVRSEKDIYSIHAMVKNNVFKAKRLLDLLLSSPPEHFFSVSTDKAANPVSVMGASKKMMEDFLIAYSSKIKITTARFANVAFSNGSLLDGFLNRIAKSQPMAGPHNIKRFFVTPQESGQLCLIACILGKSRDIFFPKLDPEKDMKSFSDIGEILLKNMGLTPKRCTTEEEARLIALNRPTDADYYPVYFHPSDTSGEKPYEEFFSENDKLELSEFHALGIIKDTPQKNMDELEGIETKLEEAFNDQDFDKKRIVDLLKNYIPNFQHIERGKNLDERM